MISAGMSRTASRRPAPGGKMLYLQPGFRLYKSNMSAAMGLKVPVWTDLNEDELQQGAEGKEEHRLEFTLSILF